MIFAGADPSVDQGTEKSHCSRWDCWGTLLPIWLYCWFCKHFAPVTVRPRIVNVLLLPSVKQTLEMSLACAYLYSSVYQETALVVLVKKSTLMQNEAYLRAIASHCIIFCYGCVPSLEDKGWWLEKWGLKVSTGNGLKHLNGFLLK